MNHGAGNKTPQGSADFVRIFRQLEPWVPPGGSDKDREARIRQFAAEQMFHPTDAADLPQNVNLPVGYTYLGQFIDHDITFDPRSSLQRQNDVETLDNFRSPTLDLDSLYGRGYEDQPYLYERESTGRASGFLRLGKCTTAPSKEPDLPRVDYPDTNEAVALIGDPRNDENLIVSQIHLTFIKLHNIVLGRVIAADAAAAEAAGRQPSRHSDLFANAQRLVRWLYQYVVWNDFVKRLVPPDIWAKALRRAPHGQYELGFADIVPTAQIPIEFSGAAYRFGHSLIRDLYLVNSMLDSKTGLADGRPIFNVRGDDERDLRGGRVLPLKHSIQWNWYFDIDSAVDAEHIDGKPRFPQFSHLIDAKLARSVFHVPSQDGGTNPLAALNILRGWRFNLPSGPDVAKAMGVTPIATTDPMEGSLWVYILREAMEQQQGLRLGEVGGRIIAAVFAALLKCDLLSYIAQRPDWNPSMEPELAAGPKHAADPTHWEMADLIKLARMPVAGGDIASVFATGEPRP